MSELVYHTLEPVFDRQSRVLILGSIPSPKSREAGFYYSHPQNRFWRVMAALLKEEVPVSPEEKRALVLRHRIALWDVLASCQIRGADDSSIRQPVANDCAALLKECPIRQVFATGKTAGRLYEKYCQPAAGMPAVVLPSTSPANCRVSLEELIQAYAVILRWL